MPSPATLVMTPRGIHTADAVVVRVGEVEVALGIEARVAAGVEGGVQGGVEGEAAIAGEARDARTGKVFKDTVGADAADDAGGLVAEDQVAGGVRGRAGDLGEGDVLSGDAGAEFAPATVSTLSWTGGRAARSKMVSRVIGSRYSDRATGKHYREHPSGPPFEPPVARIERQSRPWLTPGISADRWHPPQATRDGWNTALAGRYKGRSRP
jgi:hypothetical protein